MNSRFSLAVHILSLLAQQPEDRLTSEFLAMSIGTNAVVIRRLMAYLRKADLVTSKGAAGGGWMLARPAAKISLAMVRVALEEEVALRMHKNRPHPDCSVGQGLNDALGLVYGHVDTVIDEALGQMSVADVLADALTKVRVPEKTKRT